MILRRTGPALQRQCFSNVARLYAGIGAPSFLRQFSSTNRILEAAAQPIYRSPTVSAPPVNPVDKYAEINERLHVYGRYLMSCMPKYIQRFSVWKDELTICVPAAAVVPVFTFLKYHSAAQFKQVADITAVDYPSKEYRFEVVYNMLSHRHNARIRVKTYASETSPVPSITSLYEGANWYEREIYDLFGVFITNHPDMRRLMTDYGFEGHPLRKDFPLTGYTEVRYDEERKRVVVEPVELTQAFRNFSEGSSVWEPVGEGIKRIPDSFKPPPPPPQEEAKKDEKR